MIQPQISNGPQCCCREFLKDAEAIGGWSVELGTGPPPPATQLCNVQTPVHLRYEYPLGTQSIGHLLRDNYHGLVAIPMQFGMNASDFMWTMWPRDSGNNYQELTHVMTKYNKLIMDHRPRKWRDLQSQCLGTRLGGGALPRFLS